MSLEQSSGETGISQTLDAWINDPNPENDTFDCLNPETWEEANRILPLDFDTMYPIETKSLRDGLSVVAQRFPTSNPKIFYEMYYTNHLPGEKAHELTQRQLRKITIDPTTQLS
jgi:hypothetical protein